MQKPNVTRTRINENLISAKLSLQAARKRIQEAVQLANSSTDETLNKNIIRDYEHTVTQLLAHIDMWKLPIEIQESEIQASERP